MVRLAANGTRLSQETSHAAYGLPTHRLLRNMAELASTAASSRSGGEAGSFNRQQEQPAHRGNVLTVRCACAQPPASSTILTRIEADAKRDPRHSISALFLNIRFQRCASRRSAVAAARRRNRGENRKLRPYPAPVEIDHRDLQPRCDLTNNRLPNNVAKNRTCNERSTVI